MTAHTTIQLASGRRIGHEHPCFLVAEVGNNHQGDPSLAADMVRAAAEAGADAVKFQKRHTESLLTAEGRMAPYSGPNAFGATYGEHREALELSVEEMADLKELTESLGMVFFASAWDTASLEEMAGLSMELIKVCSADLVNLPLLRQSMAVGAPLIMSTGMSSMEQIDRAVEVLQPARERLILLHCNSSYPCPEGEICLPVMHKLRDRYDLPVGYSGHEVGIAPSLGAVALGACVIERHFTLDRAMRGTDHQVSLDPAQFTQLTAMVREVEQAMSCCAKSVYPTEQKAALKLRKSIVAAGPLPAGRVLGNGDLTVKSPGSGIAPMHWDEIMGARLTRPLQPDEQLTWDMIERP